MERQAGEIAIHYVEHGAGRPVLVLHGAGVDHREVEACLEPVFGGVAGYRRIYPDLPGMGRTVVSDHLRSAEDVLDTLLDFAEKVTDGTAYLLMGHSVGAYYAQAMAARAPGRVLASPCCVRCCRACGMSRSTGSLWGRVGSATTVSGAT
jgi:pimeloyl-ACP methyl ester carboxylesterase